MSSVVERIADALLYEGYLLYPYRRSAVKNQQRFNFGVLYPEQYAATGEPAGPDRCFMQTQCLVVDHAASTLRVKLRFLQLVERSSTTEDSASWQEATERAVSLSGSLDELLREPRRHRFAFLGDQPGEQAGPPGEPLLARQRSLDGEIELRAHQSDAGPIRLQVRVTNRTGLPDGETSRNEVLLRSLVSCHAILTVSGGEFVSLLDPPGELADAAAACENVGAWPVLVGEPGQRDTLLASPIILYDYPTIAPESPGDLFDGTEIDEILSLRILTLTDDEKREVRGSDPRARRLLERTESLTAEQLMQLHGTLRQPHLIGEGGP